MKIILALAALLGLLAVALGAIGNHLLEGVLSEQSVDQFIVALRYHQLYSILLVALSLYGLHANSSKLFSLTCILFLIGILIFCGSLYLSTFYSISYLNFGTPFGGILLMVAWLLLFFFGIFYKK